ncbi:hypothetical protein CALCODRAFT_482712 [Calocera cornea HHB12733]|uniref:Uncharacterized protein n=1 Tax=Calocera cornea HHB12733 TaxID=1353952 RepID=A0A165GFR3_9BASI|nr:hypothetical protein CALCODRAFT_482712 [Calocera cornea HHB12733]
MPRAPPAAGGITSAFSAPSTLSPPPTALSRVRARSPSMYANQPAHGVYRVVLSRVKKAERDERIDITMALTPVKTYMGGFTKPRDLRASNWWAGGAYLVKNKVYERPPSEAYVPYTVYLLETRHLIQYERGRPTVPEHVVGMCPADVFPALLRKMNDSPHLFRTTLDNAVWPFDEKWGKKKFSRWWNSPWELYELGLVQTEPRSWVSKEGEEDATEEPEGERGEERQGEGEDDGTLQPWELEALREINPALAFQEPATRSAPLNPASASDAVEERDEQAAAEEEGEVATDDFGATEADKMAEASDSAAEDPQVAAAEEKEVTGEDAAAVSEADEAEAPTSSADTEVAAQEETEVTGGDAAASAAAEEAEASQATDDAQVAAVEEGDVIAEDAESVAAADEAAPSISTAAASHSHSTFSTSSQPLDPEIASSPEHTTTTSTVSPTSPSSFPTIIKRSFSTSISRFFAPTSLALFPREPPRKSSASPPVFRNPALGPPFQRPVPPHQVVPDSGMGSHMEGGPDSGDMYDQLLEEQPPAWAQAVELKKRHHGVEEINAEAAKLVKALPVNEDGVVHVKDMSELEIEAYVRLKAAGATDLPPVYVPPIKRIMKAMVAREEATALANVFGTGAEPVVDENKEKLKERREQYSALMQQEPFFRPLLAMTFPTRPIAASVLRLSKSLSRGLPYYASVSGDDRKHASSFASRMREMRLTRMRGLCMDTSLRLQGHRGGFVGLRLTPKDLGRTINGEGLQWEYQGKIPVLFGEWQPRVEEQIRIWKGMEGSNICTIGLMDEYGIPIEETEERKAALAKAEITEATLQRYQEESEEEAPLTEEDEDALHKTGKIPTSDAGQEKDAEVEMSEEDAEAVEEETDESSEQGQPKPYVKRPHIKKPYIKKANREEPSDPGSQERGPYVKKQYVMKPYEKKPYEKKSYVKRADQQESSREDSQKRFAKSKPPHQDKPTKPSNKPGQGAATVSVPPAAKKAATG